MIAKTFILSAAFAASVASAAPVITFEGLLEGHSPGRAYEHLGVIFNGGEIRYNQDGAYLHGRSMMTFTAGALGHGISYMADGWFLDSMTWTYKGSERYEPWMIESMSYQPPLPGTTPPTVPGYYQGKVWPGVIWLEDTITGIGWNTWALDDIRFDTREMPSFTKCFADNCNPDPLFPPGDIVTAEVPEPGIPALILTGLLALAWNGRRTGSLSLSALGGARRANGQHQKHGHRVGAVCRSLPIRIQGRHG